jgi:glutamate N-acetyltransferase/amino-acid N-acetyltransferase
MSTLLPQPQHQPVSQLESSPELASPEALGGITLPKGFQASGLHAGLKKRKKDMALLVSETPATAAAVYTTNAVKAAPVIWSQALTQQAQGVKAIIINSGNANACTGPIGMQNTQQMATATADALQCLPEEVLVASTGVIGVPLDMNAILPGIPQLAASLDAGHEAAHHAAEGILTTDTHTKETAITFEIAGKTAHIGAMAKGSGMIHPNMATMLSFITTDVAIDAPLLQQALSESVDDSYHMISVDGDTSTNDMVVLLANGMAGNPKITQPGADYDAFRTALRQVNQTLAQAIAKDGEGASKFLTVQVNNASSSQQAKTLAKAVISSNLVKAAFYGADANWGRILSAMGASGAPFNPEWVDLSLKSEAGTLPLLQQGQPIPFDEDIAKHILEEINLDILIDMNAGDAQATAWGCDLTHDYLTINSRYRS